MSYHVPVMLSETLEGLITDRGGLYIDGTFGGGGHTRALLEMLDEEGRVIGCDADRVAIERGGELFAGEGERLELRGGYYGELCEVFAAEGVEPNGLMLDLGVSSRQLDSDQIGLSYREEMPLDMRFDPERREESAADIVNEQEAGEIATLLRTYGEEPAAWTIAQAIVGARRGKRIETTADLRRIIEEVIPERFRIKTLSRVFQALRIAVNDELEELRRGLDGYSRIMKSGGRIAVLSYHSLEDRIVKQFFRDLSKECHCPPGLCTCTEPQRLRRITRKPIVPQKSEIEENPRARSAKLRVAEKI